jgi:hypothetical protein
MNVKDGENDMEYRLFNAETDQQLTCDDLGITSKEYREAIAHLVATGSDTAKVNGVSVYIDVDLCDCF